MTTKEYLKKRAAYLAEIKRYQTSNPFNAEVFGEILEELDTQNRTPLRCLGALWQNIWRIK